MSCRTDGRRLYLSSGKSFVFKYKIRELVEAADVIAVCLEVPLNRTLEENVYGISQHAEMLWQIRKTPHVIWNSPFVSLTCVGGIIRAFNFDGMVYELDPQNGRILNKYFGK